jgi:hypothetical protein
MSMQSKQAQSKKIAQASESRHIKRALRRIELLQQNAPFFVNYMLISIANIHIR